MPSSAVLNGDALSHNTHACVSCLSNAAAVGAWGSTGPSVCAQSATGAAAGGVESVSPSVAPTEPVADARRCVLTLLTAVGVAVACDAVEGATVGRGFVGATADRTGLRGNSSTRVD